jgi:hypothetical protein
MLVKMENPQRELTKWEEALFELEEKAGHAEGADSLAVEEEYLKLVHEKVMWEEGRGLAYLHLARMFANQKEPRDDKIEAYCAECLACNPPPEVECELHVLQIGALEWRYRHWKGLSFAVARRRISVPAFTALHVLDMMNLPGTEVKVPPGNGLVDSLDENKMDRAAEANRQLIIQRLRADTVNNLIRRKAFFIGELVSLYERSPVAYDELEKTARELLGEKSRAIEAIRQQIERSKSESKGSEKRETAK